MQTNLLCASSNREQRLPSLLRQGMSPLKPETLMTNRLFQRATRNAALTLVPDFSRNAHRLNLDTKRFSDRDFESLQRLSDLEAKHLRSQTAHQCEKFEEELDIDARWI